MKKFLLAGVALSALLGGSAGAADLARPAPVHAPPPVIVPLFTWTGCYVGGNAGGIWARNDWNDTVFGDFGNNTASGGLGGLQGGCNYQVGAWVFGIQGDYDWTSINSTSANPALTALANAAFLPGGFAFTDQTQLKSLGSVTGRVGYSWDRFLGYVKAGGAWVNNDYTLSAAFIGTPGFATLGSVSNTRGGWTVGVGAEYAFLNWLTGFIEYDYYRFSSASENFNCVGGAFCTVATIPINIEQNISVVKVGVNFKFGG